MVTRINDPSLKKIAQMPCSEKMPVDNRFLLIILKFF